MALKTIQQEWEGFAAMIFDGTTPSAVQLQEMRKSFFAGAWSVFCAVQEIGEPHVSAADGVAWLEARRAECEEFKRQVLAEYAETN